MSDTLGSGDTKHLERFATKLREYQGYMGRILRAYQEQEGIDDTGLARQLGIDKDQLPRLALCKRPDSSGVLFANQLAQISAYARADGDALARIIRQVDALERLRGLIPPRKRDAPATHGAGVLRLTSAARDRSNDVSDEQEVPDQPEESDEG